MPAVETADAVVLGHLAFVRRAKREVVADPGVEPGLSSLRVRQALLDGASRRRPRGRSARDSRRPTGRGPARRQGLPRLLAVALFALLALQAPAAGGGAGAAGGARRRQWAGLAPEPTRRVVAQGIEVPGAAAPSRLAVRLDAPEADVVAEVRGTRRDVHCGPDRHFVVLALPEHAGRRRFDHGLRAGTGAARYPVDAHRRGAPGGPGRGLGRLEAGVRDPESVGSGHQAAHGAECGIRDCPVLVEQIVVRGDDDQALQGVHDSLGRVDVAVGAVSNHVVQQLGAASGGRGIAGQRGLLEAVEDAVLNAEVGSGYGQDAVEGVELIGRGLVVNIAHEVINRRGRVIWLTRDHHLAGDGACAKRRTNPDEQREREIPVLIFHAQRQAPQGEGLDLRRGRGEGLERGFDAAGGVIVVAEHIGKRRVVRVPVRSVQHAGLGERAHDRSYLKPAVPGGQPGGLNVDL
mmetsp:Transcript_60487/g.175170  ORF Transcript_60487/g.175170 Transcript_60487/m.175170 type:complete len:463 (+) Transcript_60487:2920-4308(+)